MTPPYCPWSLGVIDSALASDLGNEGVSRCLSMRSISRNSITHTCWWVIMSPASTLVHSWQSFWKLVCPSGFPSEQNSSYRKISWRYYALLYVVINPHSAVNSVSLSSQSIHIMAENFVELDGISRMCRGWTLAIVWCGKPMRSGKWPPCPSVLRTAWISHNSFLSPTLQ